MAKSACQSIPANSNSTDCFLTQIDFGKAELIPTIVQDDATGKVLMMAYSNSDSLTQALTQRKGIYWSRSRQSLWQKGLTSGNQQQLISADVDCDGDTILFRVKQLGNACHFDRYSCFASQTKGFDLNRLTQFATTAPITKYRKTPFPVNYFNPPSYERQKIREEAEELIEAQQAEDVRWEAADLIFFALTDALAKGVTMQEKLAMN